MLNEAPHGLLAAVIVTALHFILVPVERTWTSFGAFYVVCLAYYVSGESLALFISTWTDSEYLAIVGGVSF
ncbi:hypothetical protein DFQ27_002230, partial [Actinomortierella ambigua]